MAETSTSRTWWVALGAALAIIVLFLGVFAGPSMVGCSRSPDGFGECMQDRLADIGLMAPRQQDNIAVASDAESSDDEAADAAQTAEPETTTTEPAAEETARSDEGGEQGATEAEEAPLADLVIELVRAEPDGSLVVSGVSEPAQTVEIYADETLIGATESVRPGDWAFVSEEPLPVGPAEITARIPALGQESTRSFVVVIAENRTDAPLVVASEPGAADEVLQGLEEPQAIAEPEVNDEADSAGASDDEPAAANSAADEDDADEQPVAETEDAEMDVASLDETDRDTEDLSDQIDALTPAIQPTIDAIEIDGNSNFFAGSGEEDATIRLYVDNEFIADTQVDNGRWLIQTESVLQPRSQRIRVDQLAPGSSDVIGRAEVEFVYEAPEQQETQTAEAEDQSIEVPTPDFGIDTDEPVDIAQTEEADDPAGDTETDMAETTTDQQDDTEQSVASLEDDAESDEGLQVMTAQSLGDSERFAAGKAIIRRGDNLWTIARRVYGTGYEYVAIYRANSNQIRNPDLIYPGQVFELPAHLQPE